MLTEVLVLEHTSGEEEMRKQKLAAARKKLKSFRASRSSAGSSQSPSPSGSSSKSRSSRSSSASQPLPLPLSTQTNHNIIEPRAPLSPPTLTLKSKVLPPDESQPRLRKCRSKGSLGGHKRQQSSVNGTGSHPTPARGSVFGVFDLPPVPVAPLRSPFELEQRGTAVPEPATSPDDPYIARQVRGSPPLDDGKIRSRLSTFSFGSKAAARPPLLNIGQPLLPSAASVFQNSSLPASPRQIPPSAMFTDTQRLSTPIARPPSLLLTQPTPLLFPSPYLAGPSRSSLVAQSIPNSPASPSNEGRRRHSHNRSNSISLPNLKLGRAVPQGIPLSPNFPSSPSSPSQAPGQAGESSLHASTGISGTRLKFEPSGRGAEAEREKMEYRRKALEQLTGRRATPPESTNAEISLPDLDDEDDSSVTSSVNRPLSGSFGSFSSVGRPSSLTFSSGSSNTTPSSLISSPFSWSSPTQESFPVERWSGALAVPYSEENPGFGTFGFDPSAVKRASITTGLSVLAEVDESEEEVGVADGDIDELSEGGQLGQTPLTGPAPSRLRELHLLSSFSVTTPVEDPVEEGLRNFSFSSSSKPSPNSSETPTKGYGAIGRGRPRPLSGVKGMIMSPTGSTPTAGSHATPRSGSTSARRRTPRSASRGSSISYKKDSDAASGSSRDWSTGGKSLSSPPPLGVLGSPRASFGSPRFSGWGNIQRSAKRPCPRPQSLVGLGFDSQASNRILSEVNEVEEEDAPLAGQRGSRPTSGFGSMADDLISGRHSIETSQDSFQDNMQWRDRHLELEMERDALKEDVEMWRSRSERLEQKLEDEKRESAQLRDRFRKLGDRLSSISSASPDRPPAAFALAESRLLAELRGQVFNLTSALDLERREKDEASHRLADLPHATESTSSLPAQLTRLRKAPPPGKLLLPSSPFPHFQLSPNTSLPSPIITLATPLPDSDPSAPNSPSDPNLYRFRAWGFPSGPIEADRGQGKRESFFGLSSVVRRPSSDDGRDEDGVDLPPIAFIGSQLVSPRQPRSVSGPISSQTMYAPPSIRSVSFGTPRDKASVASLPFSSTSSPSGSVAMAALGYLPGNLTTSRTSLVSTTSQLPRTHPVAEEEVHGLDLRGSCDCCVGEVLEL